MTAPVAERVCAVHRPEPPYAREELWTVRTVWYRSLPLLPVEPLRYGPLFVELSQFIHKRIDRRAPDVRLGYIAYQAGLHPFAEVADRVVGMALVHRLRDELRMALRGREHAVHFADRLRERLFAHHVLAAVEAVNRHARMPVVRHRYENGVCVLPALVEHRAVVAIERNRVVRLAHLGAALCVYVAEREEPDTRLLQSTNVAHGPTARTDRKHRHRLARRDHPRTCDYISRDN